MTSIDIFQAIENKDFRLCRILVEGGVDINSKLADGTTVIMAACKMKVNRHFQQRKMKLVKQLMDNGADMQARNQRKRSVEDFIGSHCPRLLYYEPKEAVPLEKSSSHRAKRILEWILKRTVHNRDESVDNTSNASTFIGKRWWNKFSNTLKSSRKHRH